MRSTIKSAFISCVIAAVPALLHASSTVDFSNYAEGMQVSSVGSLSFEAIDVYGTTLGATPGSVLTPATNSAWNGTSCNGDCALTNSPTGVYPTTEQLAILFNGGASDVSFTFNNWGGSDGPGNAGDTQLSVYGSSGLLYTDDLGQNSDYDYGFGTVNVTGSGITEIVLDNDAGADNGWEFGVQSITYSGASETPEPGTFTLLGTGMVGIATMLRRRFAK
jgi:hypothetical protein